MRGSTFDKTLYGHTLYHVPFCFASYKYSYILSNQFIEIESFGSVVYTPEKMGIKNAKLIKTSREPTQQSEHPHRKESFRFEDGRRFHNDDNSKYFLPNDDDEIDRLHLQHFLIRYLWQGNYIAPIDDLLKDENSKILDLG